MQKIITLSARLHCNQTRAFEMFTSNPALESWLATYADVEPRVGGKYELYWKAESPLLSEWSTSTSHSELAVPDIDNVHQSNKAVVSQENYTTRGCRVTGIEPGKYISFEWKGPSRFQQLMNVADPLTHVTVCFLPCDEVLTPCTDIYLFHTGWGSSPQWEEARKYFVYAWTTALEGLETLING